ncbi:MAG: DUF2461 domain-containing protein [Bacteroidota bacterium]
MGCITQYSFDFLLALRGNNDRAWFEENRSTYEQSHAEALCFAETVMQALSAFDVMEPRSPRKTIYRIYRDIRFSKDKTPYKVYWGGSFKRAGASRRGGMAFHIEPGNTYIGGGFWGPNKDDLLHLRRQIAADAEPLRDVLEGKAFKKFFGSMEGQKLKTAPKGFDKTHPDIDLLNHKQFLVKHTYTDSDVLAEGFEQQVAMGFSKMLPFLEVMTGYLTTDMNGESLL